MPLKFVTGNDNVFQLLGDFVLQIPRLCSSTILFKKLLLKTSQPFRSTALNHYLTVQLCYLSNKVTYFLSTQQAE